jgi:hypothetical protein
MKIEEVLKKYEKKTGVPYKNLYERFNQLKKEFGTTRALRRLKGELQRENGSLSSQAVMFSGFIWGDTGVIDFIDLMRKKALSMYNAGGELRELAIRNKLVTRDGIPLDTRKIVNFKENPNYLGELKGHSYIQKLYGIAGKGKEMKDPKFFMMIWDHEGVKREVPYELYKMYSFRCTIGKTERNMYKLNAKGVTTFNPIEEISWKEKENLILNCGYPIYQISDIEKVFIQNRDEKHEDRTDQQYPVLLRGIAAEIDYTVNDNGNRRINVNDETMWSGSYTCWIPEHLPLEFGVDSEIIIIAKIIKGMFNNKTQYQVNVEGLFPLEGYFPKAVMI